MKELSEERDEYGAAADRVRDELLRTLRELDRRKEQWLGYKDQVIHNRSLWIAVGVIGGIAAAAALLGSVLARKRRERKVWIYRRDALVRAWRHPRRVATQREQRPALAELGMKVAMTFALAMAKRLASRSAELAVSDLRGAGAASSPRPRAP